MYGLYSMEFKLEEDDDVEGMTMATKKMISPQISIGSRKAFCRLDG